MSTRAEAAQDIRNAAPAIDSPLLDVLPQHAGANDDAVQSLDFALASDVAAALHDRDGARLGLPAQEVRISSMLGRGEQDCCREKSRELLHGSQGRSGDVLS